MWIGLYDSARVNCTHINRHKPVPEPKEIICQQINCLLTRLFCYWRFLFDNTKANQCFQILRYNRILLTNLHLDIVHPRCSLCNRFDDCIINGRLPEFLFQQISRLLI